MFACAACGRVWFDRVDAVDAEVTPDARDASVDATDAVFTDSGTDASDAAIVDASSDTPLTRDATTPDPDLLVHFTFDETGVFQDRVGTLEDGSCTDSRCPATAPGVFGNAVDFDGVDDYLLIPSSPVLDFGGSSQPFSVSIWYRTRSLDTSAQQVLVAKAANGGDVSFQASFEDLDAMAGLDIPFKVCFTSCSSDPIAIYSFGPRLETWQLVVGSGTEARRSSMWTALRVHAPDRPPRCSSTTPP